MTLEDSHSATSLQAADSGQLQLDLQDGPTTDHCGQAAPLASRLVSLEKVKEPMIQGTCGRTFIDSSVKLDRLSSWESRLVNALVSIGSTESAMILRQKATLRGRQVLQLAPSTARRFVNDSGGGVRWVTPKVVSGAYQRDGRTGEVCPNLEGQMDPSKLPADARWVTCSSRDWKDSQGMARMQGTRSRDDQLPRQMVQATGAATGSSATTENTGAPNPAFAFWLMGFPYRWQSVTLLALQHWIKRSKKAVS